MRILQKHAQGKNTKQSTTRRAEFYIVGKSSGILVNGTKNAIALKTFLRHTVVGFTSLLQQVVIYVWYLCNELDL